MMGSSHVQDTKLLWMMPSLNSDARQELWGWSALAVLAIALAGIIALVPVLSRVPGVEDVIAWPVDVFHRALVVHVVFSFIVWFLILFSALLHLVSVRMGNGVVRFEFLGQTALASAGIAFILLFIPGWSLRGEASLNNYVPVIIDPMFYTGLLLLAASVLLMIIRAIIGLIGRWEKIIDPVSASIMAGSLVFCFALFSIWNAWIQLRGEALSPAVNEYLFWGGGHVLQFFNMMVFISTWWLVGREALKQNPAPSYLYFIAVIMLFLYISPAIGFQLKYPVDSLRLRELLTALQYGLGIPALLLGGGAVYTLWHKRQKDWKFPWNNPAFLTWVLSSVIFMLGSFLGLFVDGTDTRTPGHYHGVVGGITLAGMGLFYIILLPLLNRPIFRAKLVRVQIWTYATGQVLACVGLFWAGGQGVPRKTAGSAQELDGFSEVAGMILNGVGGTTAVIGGALFVWIAGSALLSKPSYKS